MSEMHETDILAGRTRFEATRWSIIVSAQQPSSPRYMESWNELVQLYWRPVYRTIRYRWNKPVDEAKDLTQSFFATLFEGGSVQAFSPDRGRFRAFLKACLENFLRNNHRQSKRLPVAIDMADDVAVTNSENLFDREWRRTLFERAMDQLQGPVLEVVRRYYFDPSEPTYRDIAAALNLSETDVTNYLHQGKEKLRQAVRRLVQEATHSEQDFENEMRELFG
jgi:RNA polymerase sigma-70 factor (ECF subfamily)